MFIQMLPGGDEKAVDALEEMLADLPPITTIVEETVETNAGKSDEGVMQAMLERIFGGMPEEYKVQVLSYGEMEWHCDCSEERIEKALMSIGKKDLTEIIEEDGQAELTCQFCLKKYHFTKDHLLRLLEEIR
jgi:molecular chaperone Hsp33